MFKIGVLISGGGSNLQSVIDSIKSGYLNCSIECIIADRECYGLERGKLNNIDTFLLDRKLYKENLSEKIDEIISDKSVDLVVLAGFLSIINSSFVKKWEDKIINIHPSLLPKFGGIGMHGMKVHEAVIAAKEKESGCSIHIVTEEVDAGRVIDRETVEVSPNDNAKTLQEKVLKLEHILLPRAIKKIIDERTR